MMYYLFKFSSTHQNDFVENLKKIADESVTIKEVSLPHLSLSLQPAGVWAGGTSPSDTVDIDFPQLFDAILPSEKNIRSKELMFQKSQAMVSDAQFDHVNSLLNKSLQHESSDLLVFDIEDIKQNMLVIKPLLHALKHRPCPVLFLHPKSQGFSNFILKYTGKESSVYSIYAFSRLFADKARDARSSILISPFTFRKSQLATEKRLVKKVSGLFGFLGFIKLPFNEVEDYVQYSLKNNGDLIVLPRTDLLEVSRILKDENLYNEGKDKGVSIFIA